MKKNIFKYLTLILTLSLIMFAAGCKSKEITISFETNSGVQMTEIKVDQNALLTDIPDATRVGYDFVGWYYDIALSEILDETEPVLRNFTLYAKWQIQTYQIQFDVDGDISENRNYLWNPNYVTC